MWTFHWTDFHQVLVQNCQFIGASIFNTNPGFAWITGWREEGILIICTSKYVSILVVATCGNSNLTTCLASTDTELEGISNRSLVSTMEWNSDCSDRARRSQFVEAKRSLKIELDVEGQAWDLDCGWQLDSNPSHTRHSWRRNARLWRWWLTNSCGIKRGWNLRKYYWEGIFWLVTRPLGKCKQLEKAKSLLLLMQPFLHNQISCLTWFIFYLCLPEPWNMSFQVCRCQQWKKNHSVTLSIL